MVLVLLGFSASTGPKWELLWFFRVFNPKIMTGDNVRAALKLVPEKLQANAHKTSDTHPVLFI